MKEDLLILVDEKDNAIGSLPKGEVHLQGVLHRAFSVFIFNSKGELLLQQRAFNKYHSAGLWSNTCCSHPKIGETIEVAAHRRLREEMGMECELRPLFSFLYKIDVGNGLIEHEYDHVLVGITDTVPNCNILEVAGWKYLSYERLKLELDVYPNQFTEWLKICIEKYSTELIKYKSLF
jgi:isopentenyl-diphosphate delta-isomerase